MANQSRNLFLQACGASGPFHVHVRDEEKNEEFIQPLPWPFAVIGREPALDLPLNDLRVSKRHAYLQMIDGRIWCMDLESRNGIQWGDGSREANWLDRGTTLSVGPYRIRAGEPVPNSGAWGDFNPLITGFPAKTDFPAVVFEFFRGTNQHAIYRLNRVLTLVGKSSACKIRLQGEGVAKFHCSLLLTPGGAWVMDLVRREGVVVSGRPVPWARLGAGDEIQIGNFTLRLGQDRPSSVNRATSLVLSSDDSFDQTANPTVLVRSVERSIAKEDIANPSESENKAGAVQPERSAAQTEQFPLGLPFVPSEIVSSDNLPVISEAVQPLVVSLANQFMLMQQQMFDQFQQTTLKMVQMFSGLYREQFQVIQQELGELHRLNQEFQTLQAELAQGKPRIPREQSAEVSSAPPLSEENGSSATPRTTFKSSAYPKQANDPPAVDSPKEVASSVTPPSPKPQGGPSGESSVALEKEPADVHAWLAQRLDNIQDERQSRWQRILSYLRGKK